MPNTLQKYLLLLMVFALIIGCKNVPENKIWPVDTSKDKAQPVITKVYPDEEWMDADSVAFAAVGFIYIEGQGFSSNPEDNRVFFNGERGQVIEASPTKLKVKLPNVVGDSIRVHVSVKGSLLFARYKDLDYYFPFRAKSVVKKYTAVDPYVDASGLAVDANENIYFLTTDKKILKVSAPDSNAVEYGTSIFVITPCMRFGPDSALYVTRGIKSIYRVPPGGGKTKKWVSANHKVSQIDFDQNHNMFGGGKEGTIELIHLDKTKATVAEFPEGYYVNSLRVYDGYVYTAIQFTGLDSTKIMIDSDSSLILEAIYKNQILDATGNLGPNELVLNWTKLMGEDAPHITSITFDETGEMYIGLDKDQAVYLLKAGTYFYPEVLEAPATTLTWGNGKYLYINHHHELPDQRSILRVELSKKGAIYYGRPK